MTAAGRRRGTDRERAVRLQLANDDWLAFRAPASLGCADVIALKEGRRPLLIEVKSTHRGPYHGFLPADRERLRLAAKLAGADALLAWWPKNGTLRYIPANEWPRTHRCADHTITSSEGTSYCARCNQEAA